MDSVQASPEDGFHPASQPGEGDGHQEQGQHLTGLTHMEQGGCLGADIGGQLALRGDMSPRGNNVEPQELKKNANREEGEIGLQDQGKKDPDDNGPVQKAQMDRIAEQRQQAKKKPQRAMSRNGSVNSGIVSFTGQVFC